MHVQGRPVQDGRERFLAFLPQDAATIATPESKDAIRLINTNLTQLLREPADKFWKVCRSDKSLVKCLDTYLQFSREAFTGHFSEGEVGVGGDRKPGDVLRSGTLEASEVEQELSRRVFCVLWRM
eukprot:jgi/Botrbrau1/14577/Bobra.0312s0003.1